MPKAIAERERTGMADRYTALVRKSKLEYVAVCLELNVCARGEDLADVERNLRTAIELRLADLETYPETVAGPIPVDELIEFLQDTQPDCCIERALG